MDVQNMSFKASSFDTITQGCVLAHVEDPSRLLKECRRVLKSEGRLCLTVPNPFSPLTLFTNLFFPTKPATAKEHISVIPPRNLVRLFHHNGFEIEERISLGIQLPIINKRISSPLFFAQEILYILKKSEIIKDGIARLN